MRVLVVTNFEPDPGAPQRGRWVRDQVDALRALGVEVDLFSFPPGRAEYVPATRRLRTLLRHQSFDLVHAHYGLAGWCAVAAGARPLVVTFHGTDVRHPLVGPLSRRLAWRCDLVAAVSAALFAPEDGRAGVPAVPGAGALPCGPDLSRFGPAPRAEARRSLGLDPDGRYLFFAANPARPEKRHDRAAELARQSATVMRTPLATGGTHYDLFVATISSVTALSTSLALAEAVEVKEQRQR